MESRLLSDGTSQAGIFGHISMYMITNPMEHPGILVPQSRSVIQVIKVWIVIQSPQVLYLEENRPQSRYTGMQINHSRSFAKCVSIQQLVVLKITGKEGPLG